MRLAFYGLFVAGFLACSTIGIGKTLERVGGSWTAWPMLAGIVLGAAILALTAAFATGYRPVFLPSDGVYVAVLGVLIASKVVVSLAAAATTVVARG